MGTATKKQHQPDEYSQGDPGRGVHKGRTTYPKGTKRIGTEDNGRGQSSRVADRGQYLAG